MPGETERFCGICSAVISGAALHGICSVLITRHANNLIPGF